PATGKGAILFPVAGYSKSSGYFTGGKVVGIDLANMDTGKPVFQDSALILGEAGWMKRVFDDKRIQVLLTFSADELAAFPSFAETLKNTKEKVDAIRRVELARDLVTFLTLNDGLGIQIVRKGSYYGANQSTQLRLVKQSEADADASKITA